MTDPNRNRPPAAPPAVRPHGRSLPPRMAAPPRPAPQAPPAPIEAWPDDRRVVAVAVPAEDWPAWTDLPLSVVLREGVARA